MRVSKVPSVPVLFDDEPQTGEEDVGDTDDRYPEVMLEPLHMLDPLCIKWKLGAVQGPAPAPAAPAAPKAAAPEPRPQPPVAQPAPQAAPQPAPPAAPRPQAAAPVGMSGLSHAPIAASAPIPASSRLASGYLRLLGLLANGSPWECSIPLADMSRPGGMTIGRDASCCEIVLTESSISRRHVALEYTGNGVVITDQGSTNGTYLNGRRLSYYDRCVPLQDGSILGLGDVSLRVEIFDASASYYPV